MQLSFSDMKIKKKVVCKYELHGKRKRSQWGELWRTLVGTVLDAALPLDDFPFFFSSSVETLTRTFT